MNKAHAEMALNAGGETWQPVRPPKRGEVRTAFHAHMLLPGLSVAFHAAALDRSRSSIYNYRAEATEAARSDPAIMAAVDAMIRAIRAEHGLDMARCRGPAQLPHWSCMAIREYRHRGVSRAEIAKAFRCSLGTVTNVVQERGRGYEPASGRRRLTGSQQRPPASK